MESSKTLHDKAGSCLDLAIGKDRHQQKQLVRLALEFDDQAVSIATRDANRQPSLRHTQPTRAILGPERTP
jgi:hypothetical protein